LPHYFGGFLAVDELIEPALKNACAIRHPIYDPIYLEAARRLDAQLVTATVDLLRRLPVPTSLVM